MWFGLVHARGRNGSLEYGLGHAIAVRLVDSPGMQISSTARVAILPAPRCDLVGKADRCRQCRRGKSHLACDELASAPGAYERLVTHKLPLHEAPAAPPALLETGAYGKVMIVAEEP
mgnify:CR=1 FL=1